MLRRQVTPAADRGGRVMLCFFTHSRMDCFRPNFTGASSPGMTRVIHVSCAHVTLLVTREAWYAVATGLVPQRKSNTSAGDGWGGGREHRTYQF